ncbi:hypothetical protein Bmul_0801 [Burkholderia multivorans ATCC 17616]|nr:hypothetical protein Bmul_0801 [Burkholderia multivorans ATCC 17616]
MSERAWRGRQAAPCGGFQKAVTRCRDGLFSWRTPGIELCARFRLHPTIVPRMRHGRRRTAVGKPTRAARSMMSPSAHGEHA